MIIFGKNSKKLSKTDIFDSFSIILGMGVCTSWHWHYEICHYQNHPEHKFHSEPYEQKFVHFRMGVRGDYSSKSHILAQTEKRRRVDKVVPECHPIWSLNTWTIPIRGCFTNPVYKTASDAQNTNTTTTNSAPVSQYHPKIADHIAKASWCPFYQIW